MKSFIIRWLCTTLAVAIAVWVTGINYAEPWQFFAAALLLGFVNAFIRPVLLLLSLPAIIFTLGLFILIVNTLVFWLASRTVGLGVSGFWQAFFAALVVSAVNWALSSIFRTQDGQIHIITHHGVMKQANARVIEDTTRE